MRSGQKKLLMGLWEGVKKPVCFHGHLYARHPGNLKLLLLVSALASPIIVTGSTRALIAPKLHAYWDSQSTLRSMRL